jgi:hypothetical protein
MQSFGSKSFVDVLKSSNTGIIDEKRYYAMIGKERHDIGRPNNAGYPIRGIIRVSCQSQTN